MHEIVVQNLVLDAVTPDTPTIEAWGQCALNDHPHPVELTLRIVDLAEMTALNHDYRHKMGPTNVLAFPFDAPDDTDLLLPILGDVVICAPVVAQEAAAQGKAWEAHWAHMVIHGILHLRGFDHQTDDAAQVMEARETALLQSLGFPNPYL